ncbi:MAG: hypothetical protein VXZ20_04525 [Actinomycetota bacterium]|nr:hypothetical protein [Actinomycetota bacterium]
MTAGPCFRAEDAEFQDYEFEDSPDARDGDDTSCGDEFESAAGFFAAVVDAVVFFFAVDFFAVVFFAVDFFAVVFFAVDSAALDDVASALVVAGVVTAEACVTGESIACHCGDAAGSIIRRHNHQPPTTTPPRTARLKSLRMERTLTATRYPRHRLPTPQPALSAERNFSSAAPLLQKACC